MSAFAGAQQVVFIDSSVQDIQELIAGLAPGVEAFVLDPSSDGVQQIADILAADNLTGLDSISIVGEGSPGAINLGSTVLDDSDLSANATALAQIGASLAPGGSLALYGSDVANGPAGRQFVADLSSYAGGVGVATSASTAALTDLNGAAAGSPLVPVDPGPNSTVTVVNNTTTSSNTFGAVFDVAYLTGGDTVLLGATPPGASDELYGNSNALETNLQAAIVSGTNVNFFDVPLPGGTVSTDYIGGASMTALSNGNFAVLYWGSNVSDGTLVGGGSPYNTNLPNYYVQIFTPSGTPVGSLITLDAPNNANGYAEITEDPANNGFVVSMTTGNGTGLTFQRFTNAGVAGDSFTLSNYADGIGSVDGSGNILEEYWDSNYDNQYYSFVQNGASTASNTVELSQFEEFTPVQGGGFVGFYFDSSNNLVAQTVSTTGALGAPITLGNVGQTIAANNILWSAVTLTNGNYVLTLEPDTSNQEYTGYPGSNQVIEVGSALTAADTTIYDLTTSGGAAAQLGPWAVAGPAGGIVTFNETAGNGTSVENVPLEATVTAETYLETPPPVVTAGASATFTGGGAATALDSGVTVSATGGTLASATVSIGSGFISGDTLSFTNTSATSYGNITGSYDSSTGVLTLTSTGATATGAQWQTALDSITYSFNPSNGDPTGGGSHTTRTIDWSVTDGTSSSAAATSTLDAVHVAPTVSAGATATFTGGGAATALDGALTVSDADSGGDLVGATVSIGTGFLPGDTLNFTSQNGISDTYNGATGVLSLAGTATIANYQTALESITYSFTPSNGDPTYGGSRTTRTIEWSVNDGAASSTTATSTLDAVHVAPTVSAGATATFTGGGAATALDSALTVSDPDSGGKLASATVSVGSGFVSGDLLSFTNTSASSYGNIGSTYNSSTGALTLTSSGATATVAQWQAALDSVTYSFAPSNGDPTGGGSDATRTIDWTVNDGTSVSTAATSMLGVHTPPTVSAGATATFTGGGAATALDGALTVSDADSGGDLASATVSIGSGFLSGDTLSFTNQNGIAGSYNSATGALTLTSAGATATVAQWQAALESVTYSFTSGNGDPTGGGSHTSRTIDWVVNDGTSNSATATSTLDTTPAPPPIVVAEDTSVVAGATVASTSGGSALEGDSDPDTLPLSISAINGGTVGTSLAGAYGHLTLNADGSYSYVADQASAIAAAATGSHPVDTFTYTVSDTGGGSTSATIAFTIDRAPVAMADTNAAGVDGPAVTGNVTANDSDPDGDTLTVTGISDTANGAGAIGAALAGQYGTLTLSGSGAYTYTPNATISAPAGSHPTDLFTYTESDGDGASTTGTLTISLDRAPTTVAAANIVLGGASVSASSAATGVLGDDSDPDNDPLTVASVDGGAGNVGTTVAGLYGALTLNADGTYSYAASNAAAIAAAGVGVLTDTFTYTASDGDGGAAASSLTISIVGPDVTVGELQTYASLISANAGYQVAVIDTAANIVGGLGGLTTQASLVSSITATGGAVSVSVATFLADQAALDKVVGGFSIDDTAANIAANLDHLNDANLNSIAIADNAAVGVSVAQLTGDATAIGKLANANGAAYQLAVSDTAANVAASIDALNADSAVASITLTDGGTPTLTLTAAQALDDTAALGKITNVGYAIAISDTAANVSASIDALNADPAVTSITLTDSGTPTLTLTAAQALGDTTALGKITNGSYAVAIADTAADVAANIDALNADPAVASITLTDSGTPVLALSQTQDIDDASVLAKIASPYTLAITDPGVYDVGFTAAQVSVSINPDGSVKLVTPNGTKDFAGVTTIDLADATIAVSGNTLTQTNADGSLLVSTFNIAGQEFTSKALAYDADGRLQSKTYDGVTGEGNLSSFEYLYAGANLVGSDFFYTGVTGQPYTGEEVDYDGGANLTRIAFTGVTGTGYSAYEYDYVGGVFEGAQYTVTSVPHGASYSSYQLDFNNANVFTGDKFFFTGITGQAYTGEEEDFDASGTLAKVVLSGVTGQAYSSLEMDYSAGTYTGYKADYTDVAGANFASEEVDANAANQVTKAVYTGVTGQAYSSIDQDYVNGAAGNTTYGYTNVTGASYNAYQVEDNASGALMQTTDDLNTGGHAIVGAQNGLTITSLGDDTITGGGSGETFVFNGVYGHDAITDFSSYDTGASHDVISLPTSEFANFAAVMSAATNSGSNAVIAAADGDTLTLKNLTTTTLASLGADFTFHA